MEKNRHTENETSDNAWDTSITLLAFALRSTVDFSFYLNDVFQPFL